MFSTRLKELRQEKGLTQERFAQGLNVSKGAVAMWETGKRTPDADMLMTIANYFKVTVDELIGNEHTTDEPQDKIKDRDIYRIQRMKKKATDEEWDKFMKIAEVSFDKYFSDDYVDDDTDE